MIIIGCIVGVWVVKEWDAELEMWTYAACGRDRGQALYRYHLRYGD